MRLPIVCLCVAGALLAAVPAAGRPHAGSPGAEIVFASTRAWNQPGEVYLARVGAAPRNVTRSAAADTWVAAAPRGNTIAFWSDRGGREQAYLALADGSHVRPIRGALADASEVQFPGAFSPDGRTLVLVADRGAASPVALVVDVATATAHRLSRRCDSIDLSPDGTLVGCRRLGDTFVLGLDGRTRFRTSGEVLDWTPAGLVLSTFEAASVVDRSGRRLHSYRGGPLAVSPDGRWLAMTDAPGTRLTLQRIGGESHVVDPAWRVGNVRFTPDSGALAYHAASGDRLVPVGGGAGRPLATIDGRWSADGRRYAYVTVAPGALPGSPGAIVVGDRYGAHPRTVGHLLEADGLSRLVWLSDGRRLLYEEQSRGSSDLYAVQADGSGLRRLTRDPRDERDPAWSPDGRELVYSRGDQARTEPGCGHGNCTATLVWASIDGSLPPRTFVTFRGDDGVAVDQHASWAPSGDAVAFAHDGLDGFGIAMARMASGSSPTILRSGLDRSAEPAWSPDGTQIAFVDGSGIEGLTPDGAQVELLVARPGTASVHDPAWSPDGHLIAFSEGDALYVAAPGGPALEIARGGAAHPSFSPDGGSIVFVHGNDLSIVGVDGRGLRTITHTPRLDETAPAWRPLR